MPTSRINPTVYIGYWGDKKVCISPKPNAIKKYLTEQRHCKEASIDITSSTKRLLSLTDKEESILLTKYSGTYVTQGDMKIIYRDFTTFMDNLVTTRDTLSELSEIVKEPKLKDTIDYCNGLLSIEDNAIIADLFVRYFTCHFLTNMHMATYIAYMRNYPGYMGK